MLVLLLATACFPRLSPSAGEETDSPADDSGALLVETRCGDDADDDGDGDIDCDDADCIDARVCEDADTDTDTEDTDTLPDQEADCSDGRDDDDDGDVDCDDRDCVGDSACTEPDECWDTDIYDDLGPSVASGTAAGNDGNGSCGGGSTADTFVAWTAPATDTYMFDTVGSAADTTLWVTSDTCDGTELACDDDTFGTDSQVSVALTRGDTVVVGVEAAGSWVLNAWQGDCPQYSIGSELAVSGTTTSSMPSLTSSICTTDPLSAATLRWIAPSAGVWTFSTADSAYDTVLALYEETCDGAEIDCNDDTGDTTSEISTYLSAGEVVAIAVGGYEGAAGEYLLTISAG
ncbi:MAG: hypothetical protein Q8P18_06450 [Pseudomonadota bacterium]|nr:hypothetical protein [Pseudomonadota bacterium]